ncbi:RIP metalloprotease RseP [Tateyamaria omphalii]|uniref:Zinc metalloprotease n=1 Tax=Tateyamaria omphalii TaxID=299262 RepID=A0A1P8MTD6_9RHOB|nr:RIP metalloprotease RseP [Tateyamaria omphalii]APX11308.1 RIP metalloprotease RseP [Tateyamaria omphalii]
MDISALIPAFGGFAWTIFFFIVALSVIVAIHEYGHYIVGRWSGIHADVFSIGFGPVIYSRVDKRGTKWQIAALPFGGYVKFAGDANAASGKDEAAMEAVSTDPAALRRTMHGAPLWARAATVAAGPAFNFVLSIMVFAIVGYSNGVPRDPLTVGELYTLPTGAQDLQPGDVVLEIDGTPVPSLSDPAYADLIANLTIAPQLEYTVERDGERMVVQGPYLRPPLVRSVTPRSAALAAGLEQGDVITSINGEPVFAFRQLVSAVEGSDGATLELGVWRGGETLEKSLAPKRVDEPQDGGGFATQWRIGVASGNAFDPASEAPGVVDAVTGGVEQTWRIITGSISGLGHMITGAISTCNLSGPIGIAQVSGTMASQGAQSFVWFIAVLSTAVGLLNLFPIPALDGGHLVFYAYEAVTGKPPSDGALRVLMAFGLTLVLSLMIFAVGNDLFCP